MEVSREEMKTVLKNICKDLDLNIEPKDFQIDFFCRAVSGANGFLRVIFDRENVT